MSERWPKHIEGYKTLTEENFGQYLSASLRGSATEEDFKQVKQLKKGVFTPNLRVVQSEKKQSQMMFDKFRSEHEVAAEE